LAELGPHALRERALAAGVGEDELEEVMCDFEDEESFEMTDGMTDLVSLVMSASLNRGGVSAGRLALVEFHRRRTAACVQAARGLLGAELWAGAPRLVSRPRKREAARTIDAFVTA
jgi:hypothetical protein